MIRYDAMSAIGDFFQTAGIAIFTPLTRMRLKMAAVTTIQKQSLPHPKYAG